LCFAWLRPTTKHNAPKTVIEGMNIVNNTAIEGPAAGIMQEGSSNSFVETCNAFTKWDFAGTEDGFSRIKVNPGLGGPMLYAAQRAARLVQHDTKNRNLRPACHGVHSAVEVPRLFFRPALTEGLRI
jgi:hypothetical protein